MKIIEGTHIAVSDFKPDTLHSMWIENLNRSGFGIDLVTDALGFKRTVYKGKLRFVGMPCIRCGATVPTADSDAWTVYRTPGSYPDSPSRFGCEIGNHGFTLADLIDHTCPTKTKKRALLNKIGTNKPQLQRFYSAEHEGIRGESADAQEAVTAVLTAAHDCKARLVGLEAPSLEIARQVAGQCHDDLPWAVVELEPDGTIIDLGWHKGRPTERERAAIRSHKIAVRAGRLKTLEADVASYREARAMELGL